MTRIAFVADVHLGNHKRAGGAVQCGMNERCSAALRTYRAAVSRARALECDAFVVLGDLVDYDRPEAQLLAAVQEVHRAGDLPIYLVVGNHEQRSTTAGDHALGPLEEGTNVRVVEQPELVSVSSGGGAPVALALVPHAPGPGVDRLPAALAAVLEGCDAEHVLLGMHLGVSDERTAKWLVGAEDSVPLEQLRREMKGWDIAHAFAGNWHDRRQWPGVLQLGALVPTGWDNAGFEGYGTLAYYDVEEGRLTIEEVSGPRYYSFSAPNEHADLSQVGPNVYLEVLTPPEHVPAWAARLAALRERGQLAGFEVWPEDLRAVEAAREAAAAARAGKELGGTLAAMAAYIDKMNLPPHVDRARVLAGCRRFLGV